jgi:hypothetical protein
MLASPQRAAGFAFAIVFAERFLHMCFLGGGRREIINP